MKKFLLAAILTGFAGFVLTGCPELTPFLVNGTYAGQYTLGQEGSDTIGEAPIEVELSTGASGLFAANKLEGEVILDFSTNAIAQLLTTLGIVDQGVLELPPIPVKGVLAPDGTLLLNSVGILEECSEDVCIRLGIEGIGEDSDADGKMDKFDGTWVGGIQKGEALIPLYGNFHTVLAQ